MLSLITSDKTAWWTCIPGGILDLVCGMMLAGKTGLMALEVLGHGWPIVLIAMGFYLVLRRKDLNEQ